MSRFSALLPILALTALTACTTTGTPRPAEYRCDDRSAVQALYPNPNTAILIMAGETHRLQLTSTGDGHRYTGDRIVWTTFEKGATLTHGTRPSTTCVAPDRVYPISSSSTQTISGPVFIP